MEMELEDYAQALYFTTEFDLNKAPFIIDLLIIKKERELSLHAKHIAALFLAQNILEFKGPDDYLSIDAFNKVLGLTLLYSATSGKKDRKDKKTKDDKVPLSDLTITFVVAKYPDKLIKHLQKERGCQITEKWKGIYYITGMHIPIQIIVIPKLAADETCWLKHLNKHHSAQDISRIIKENFDRREDARFILFLKTIAKSNKQAFQEALNMEYPTFEEVLEGTPLPAIWEARGKAEGKAEEAREVITRALQRAIALEDIAFLTGYDIQTIEQYQKELHL
ncbi:hypothetical protein ACYULU_04875 [Breznakiellaceae bacterium SP9]